MHAKTSGLFIAILVAGSISLFANGKNLILMRHGQADHNVQRFYSSNPYHPNYKPSHLTTKGKQQVAQTACRLMQQGFGDDNITVVYVSPLPRTQETAQNLVANGLIDENKIIIDPRITEIQFGMLEGLSSIPPWEESNVKKYHAESDEQLTQRVESFYCDLLNRANEGNILVITHGGVALKLMQVMNIKEGKPLRTGEAIVLPIEEQSFQQNKIPPQECSHVLYFPSY
jgi:broad specificity phosphatase PhoE